MRAVISRVAIVLVAGMALGAVLASGTGPVVSSMVPGVSPRDPLLLIAVVLLLGVIAFVSSAGPLRRSLRVDPLTNLKED